MENRAWNQESRRRVKTEQNTDAYPTGGAIGGRSSNLVKLIGADNVSRRNFKYEGTWYVTEDGELYDKEYIIAQRVQRTGVNFYEVVDWEYDERKKLYQPTIRRIVMIKNTNTQLSLNLKSKEDRKMDRGNSGGDRRGSCRDNGTGMHSQALPQSKWHQNRHNRSIKINKD